MGPTASGIRRDATCVSGSRKAYHIESASPKALTVRKVMRQPIIFSVMPPSSGENPGAAAIATITIARTRARVSPSYISLAIARASTDAAHTPAACIARPTISSAGAAAWAHTTPPAAKTSKPPMTSLRRPKRSDRGPTKSCPAAKTTKKTLSVRPSWASDAPRVLDIAGNDGRMMLVDKAPIAASAANRRTTPRFAVPA